MTDDGYQMERPTEPGEHGYGHPPTVRDVARHANVSRQTVSRVINGRHDVHPATRRRVLDAIRELGYRPNSLARSLATRQSRVLGLVVPDITQPFYPQIARGVEDGAYPLGYSVFLCNTAGSPKREISALERLRGHRIAGAIVCNSRLEDDELTQVLSGAFPVVLVNRDHASAPGTVIWPDYETGTAMAVEHLLSRGRHHIAYLGVDYPSKVDDGKRQGYINGLRAARVPIDPRLVQQTDNSFQGGYDALARLVDAGVPCDALVAFNDLIAIGAMRYAATRGIAVPADLALVGFGGSDLAAMMTPTLSTVSIPLHAIGLTAVQELLDLIQGHTQERRQVTIQPELRVGGSSDER